MQTVYDFWNKIHSKLGRDGYLRETSDQDIERIKMWLSAIPHDDNMSMNKAYNFFQGEYARTQGDPEVYLRDSLTNGKAKAWAIAWDERFRGTSWFRNILK